MAKMRQRRDIKTEGRLKARIIRRRPQKEYRYVGEGKRIDCSP